jgi:tetratricopeptide (TPR) repeat protein
MHRQSPVDYERARRALQLVVDRAPRRAEPRAWLAKWHVLKLMQGWSHDIRDDAQAAIDETQRALDLDPGCSLALAVDGLVQTHFTKRFDVAQQRYETAVDCNPNDSLAWLLKGTLHAFRGEGVDALHDSKRALRLSPLDPIRYFYDSLSATAALAGGEPARAVELAERSLKANRRHRRRPCRGRRDAAARARPHRVALACPVAGECLSHRRRVGGGARRGGTAALSAASRASAPTRADHLAFKETIRWLEWVQPQGSPVSPAWRASPESPAWPVWRVWPASPACPR